MLTAYYDLAHSPPTYDFVSFLLNAEWELRKRNQDQVKVTFLPGPVGGFRRDRFWPHSVEQRDALLRDLVMPMCKLLPSCVGEERGTRVRDSGPSFGFNEARYGLKVFVDAMRAIGPALRAPGARKTDDRLVTITLRECEHWPERNSDVPEWIEAARAIQDFGFDVVFVRDTLRANEPLPGFCTDPVAAVDVLKRAELYSKAFCNLSVSNGPAWLAMALGAPLLMFRPCDDSSENPAAQGIWFQRCGIPRGGQVPGALPQQRLVWARDTCPEIVEQFANHWSQSCRASVSSKTSTSNTRLAS